MANILGTDNDDTLFGNNNEDDIIWGFGGMDWLYGLGGNDILKGGGGDDVLVGGEGADILNGGTGNDTAVYVDSAEGVIVDLSSGTGSGGTAEGDTLVSIEYVDGSNFNDIIFGNNVRNEIRGFDGKDTIKGFGGDDELDGGSNHDILVGGEGADILNGGSGHDTAVYADSDEGVVVNLFSGTGSGGTAEGDTLISIEYVDGSDFNDTIIGNNVRNEIRGGGGNDTIKGFGGNDALDGGVGNDVLLGGDGDDLLVGGGNADILNGGSGTDTASYWGSFGGVVVNLFSGTGSGGAAEGDSLVSIENVDGSRYNDTIIGNDVANELSGLLGNDTLKGFGGDDVLYGGQGNDQLIGGDGHDKLFGESGEDKLWGGDGSDWLFGGIGADQLDGGAGDNDVAWYDDSYAGVTVYLESGLGFGGDAEGDTLSNIEWLEGSIYGDYLFGDDNANYLGGSNGKDTLSGLGGNDHLSGGADADLILGGEGSDILYGGSAGDVFAWTDVAESSAIGVYADFVGDFSQLEGDVIDVHLVDADTTVRGDQAFTFIGTAPFTAPGQINYATAAAATFIYFNTDATYILPEMTIRLAGVYTLDASDFVL